MTQFTRGLVDQQNFNSQIGLRDRELSISEAKLNLAETEQKNQVMQDKIAAVNERKKEVLTQLDAHIKAGVEAGLAPDQIKQSTLPLVSNYLQLIGEAENSQLPFSVNREGSIIGSKLNSIFSLQDQQVAEQTATAQGEVANAETKLQAINENQDENFANLLGIKQEARPELVKLLDELSTFPPGSREFEAIKGRINKLSTQSQFGFELTTDPEGNISLRVGESGIPKKQQLPGTGIDKLRGDISAIDSGIAFVDSALELIESDPTRFGIGGSIRKGATNIAGMLGDLAALGFQQLGIDVNQAKEAIEGLISEDAADESVANELRPASPGELDVYMATLKYSVARALQEEGKILMDAVKTAEDMTDLTGLKSSVLVEQKLMGLRSFLESRRTAKQRRIEQGVTGQAQTPQASPVPEGVGASEGGPSTDLDAEVKNILGL